MEVCRVGEGAELHAFGRYMNISHQTHAPVTLSQETEANLPHFTHRTESRVSATTDVEAVTNRAREAMYVECILRRVCVCVCVQPSLWWRSNEYYILCE
jgi:hypothetical protein